MELSPEERQRIAAEEREREAARKKIEGETTGQVMKGILGCFGFIVAVVVVIVLWAWLSGNGDSPRTPAPARDLKASVVFNQRQFVISNKDSFDWTNVRLEINYGLMSSGYQLKVPRIAAGQTYTVGAMQFAKSDGTRFNPRTTKAQKLFISCDTPNGKATYFGTWD